MESFERLPGEPEPIIPAWAVVPVWSLIALAVDAMIVVPVVIGWL